MKERFVDRLRRDPAPRPAKEQLYVARDIKDRAFSPKVNRAKLAKALDSASESTGAFMNKNAE